MYKEQVQKLAKLKNDRDNLSVTSSLKMLEQACRSGDNVMEYIIKAAKSYATLGEIVDTMKNI